MKTALVAVPRGWDVRSLLRTGVLDVLKSSGVRPVLLTPKASDPDFRAEFGRFDLEPYRPHQPGRLEGTFRRALNVSYSVRFPDHTLDIMARRLASHENRESLLKRSFWAVVRGASRASPALHDALRTLEFMMPDDRDLKGVFEKWKPDAVISTPLFDWTDVPLLKWCRRLKVPSLSIVASWDNVSSKGTIQIRPDALIVWNEDMADEACRTHGYERDRVAVTGVPHFDHWAEPERSREAFLRKYGLDPALPVIGYFGAGARVHPSEYECFAHLVEANEKGAFGDRLPIFVRLHPREYRTQWDTWRNRPGVIIDTPEHAQGRDWDANRADLDHLADTVRACAVSMNVCSTITIESCIADRPVFNIGYDGDQVKPEMDSAARYYRYSHYKRIPDCGIPVAWSREEMIDLTRRYLRDPALDREARARVATALCGPVGGAAERMGRALAAFVIRGASEVTRA